MNYNEIIKKYEEKKLKNHYLKSIQDIFDIYGIDYTTIKGYDMLTEENQTIYKQFVVNLYRGLGLEARMELKPLEINFVEEKNYMIKERSKDTVDNIEIRNTVIAIYNNGKTKILSDTKNKDYKNKKAMKVYGRRYLKFEYLQYKNKAWLHVITPSNYY